MNSPEEPGQTSFLGQIFTLLIIGVVIATLLTSLTPASVLASNLASVFINESEGYVPPAPNEFPTPTPRPRPLVGIVAGHWGNDPGTVCADNLTEVEVNLTIATIVRDQLVMQGYDVDLLKEFDPRLQGYRALALVSIHADSCEYINDEATGYKIASSLGSSNSTRAARLAACIKNRYGSTTELGYHGPSITLDMSSYHAFDEIHHETPSVIIETGFLNLDRQILTKNPAIVAEGITNGIVCYIRNENVNPESE